MSDYLPLQEEAYHLAQQLLGNEMEKCAGFTNRLLDICTRAQDKDFLDINFGTKSNLEGSLL